MPTNLAHVYMYTSFVERDWKYASLTKREGKPLIILAKFIIDRHEVDANKNADKERRQYPAF